MARTPAPIMSQPRLFDGDAQGEIGELVQRTRRSAGALTSSSGRKRIAFGWYGGKYSHLDWLLPLLPPARQYCEPFGGSAAVLINRDPAEVETYNDLDGEVVNFFRVLRERKSELIESIGLTPFSREEFAIACKPASDDVSDFERAAAIFQCGPRQVRTGLACKPQALDDGQTVVIRVEPE